MEKWVGISECDLSEDGIKILESGEPKGSKISPKAFKVYKGL